MRDMQQTPSTHKTKFGTFLVRVTDCELRMRSVHLQAACSARRPHFGGWTAPLVKIAQHRHPLWVPSLMILPPVEPHLALDCSRCPPTRRGRWRNPLCWDWRSLEATNSCLPLLQAR